MASAAQDPSNRNILQIATDIGTVWPLGPSDKTILVSRARIIAVKVNKSATNVLLMEVHCIHTGKVISRFTHTLSRNNQLRDVRGLVLSPDSRFFVIIDQSGVAHLYQNNLSQQNFI